MRIDRIEPSRRKKDRVLVFLEGGDLLRVTEQELLVCWHRWSSPPSGRR